MDRGNGITITDVGRNHRVGPMKRDAVVVVVKNKVFIWYHHHLGYYLGCFKNSFFAGFKSPAFRFYLYLQTWDASTRVREYQIKLFKIESLGLGLRRFWGLNSHRPSQNPIFGEPQIEKTPVDTRIKLWSVVVEGSSSFLNRFISHHST